MKKKDKKSIVNTMQAFWKYMVAAICLLLFVMSITVARNSYTYLHDMELVTDSEIYKLDETFQALNLYMNNVLNNNENLICLKKAKEKLDIIYYSKCLRSDIQSTTVFLPDAYGFCLEIPEKDIFLTFDDTGEDYNRRKTIQNVIRTQFHSGEKRNKLDWQIKEIDGEIWIIQTYYSDGCYFTAWISSEKAFGFFDTTFAHGKGKYEIIPNSGEESHEKLKPVRGVLEKNIRIERLNAIIQYSYQHQGMTQTTGLIFLILILLMCGLIVHGIWFSYYFHYRIIYPLQDFCKRISNQKDLEEIKEEMTFAELYDAAQLVSSLYVQIKELKINAYEDTIRQQKMELEFLQLQLRPHFYVNCLNLIFQMVQNQQYERIQLFCVKLSGYMRYLFSSGIDTVLIQQEIEHIKEYLYVQNIRFCSDIEIEEDKLPGIKLEIPQLVLLCLVENSVKHNQGNLNALKIRLKVVLQEGTVQYILSDNGKGFQNLDAIKDVKTIIQSESKSVGLRNIVRRLHLVYGNNYSITFRNDNGAVVEISIPI